MLSRLLFLALFVLSTTPALAQDSLFPTSDAVTICGLTDVACTSTADGNILVYLNSSGNYVAVNMSGNCTITAAGVMECGAYLEADDCTDLNPCSREGALCFEQDDEDLYCCKSNAYVACGASGGGGGTTEDVFKTHAVPNADNPVADTALDTLTYTAGSGIDIAGTASSDTIDFACENATTSNIGCASFNSANFAASSGDITIKASGVTSTEIATNSVGMGSDTTGNYVATVADGGGSTITVTGSGSETAAITLDVIALTSADSNPADAGVIRLGNAELIAAEASPAGTDGTINFTSSEIWEFSHPVEAVCDSATAQNCGIEMLENAGAGSAAGSNSWRIYGKSTGVYVQDDAGTETGPIGTSTGDVSAVGDCTGNDAFTADGTGNTLHFEGSSADAYEVILTSENATDNDKTVTLPNESGTVELEGHTHDEDEIDDLQDYLLAETNSLEVLATGAATTQVFVGTGANAGAYVALGGDVSMTNAGVVTIATVDSITDTNLVDKSATEAITGDWDFGGGGIEIENGASPPSCTQGQLYLNSALSSGERLMACEGSTFVLQGDGDSGGGAGEVNTISSPESGLALAHSTPKSGVDLRTVSAAAADFDLASDVLSIDAAIARDSELHSVVTVSGTPDYITLSGQDIVRGSIVLTTDVSGELPDANVSNTLTASISTLAAEDTNSTAIATTSFVQQELNGAGGTGLACSSGSCNVALGTTIDNSEWSGTDLSVANGGTGASTLVDGGVLLGNGTSAVSATDVLADSEFIVGDGTTAPVLESGATLRTSIGVGTGDSPQFTGIELGHATDTTIVRSGAGALTVEGTAVLLAGGETITTAGDMLTLTSKDIDWDGMTVELNGSDVGDMLGIDFGTVFSVATQKACVDGTEVGETCVNDGDCDGSGTCTDDRQAYVTLSGSVYTEGNAILATDMPDEALREDIDNLMDDAKEFCLGAGSDGCIESNGTDVDVTGTWDMQAAVVQLPTNATPAPATIGEIELDTVGGEFSIYTNAAYKFYSGRHHFLVNGFKTSIGISTTQVYVAPHANFSSVWGTIAMAIMPGAVTCDGMYVRLQSNIPTGATLTVALYDTEGGADGINCDVAAGTNTCSDTETTITYAAGDRYAWRVKCADSGSECAGVNNFTASASCYFD